MSMRLHDRAQLLPSTLWQLVVPPLAWAAHFVFAYAFAAIRCAKAPDLAPLGDVRLAIGIATVLALGVVAVSGFVALAQSRRPGDPAPHQESTEEDRFRFLAFAKLLLAGLSFVAIVFTAIPAFVFEDCR